MSYILPVVVAFSLVIVYPVVSLVRLSFYTQPALSPVQTYVGFENYTGILSDNDGFLNSLWITLIYAGGGLVVQLAIGLGYALLLRERVWGRAAVLGIVVVPYLIPSVASVAVWKWMFDPTSGIINSVLMSSGLIGKPLSWLQGPTTALLSVIVVGSWRQFPFVVLGILGRLESIPKHLYEAASIDGASVWGRFFTVTLPQLRGVLIVTIFLRFIFDFNDYDTVALLTAGGPAGSTRTLPVYIYQQMFDNARTGQAAASATLVVLLLTVLMIAYFTLFRRTELR